MAATGFTPIQLYRTTTASAVPTSGNLADGELAINTTDEKLYFKNAAGTVKLLASTAGTAGDVAGPASATDNALAAFDGTTGKLIKNASLTANNVLLGNGTGAPQVVAPGTAGNVLTSNGTTWSSTAPAVTLAGAETLTNKTIAYANNTLTGVQPTLVSGTNIKTINGASVLGSGDLAVTTTGTIQFAPSTSSTLLSNTINAFLNGAGTYTLPDLTGQTSFGLASFNTTTTAPATVTTSDGWSITTSLSASTTEFIAPIATATAHGIWGSLAMTPPTLSTTSGFGNTLLGSVVLSATLAVLLIGTTSSSAYAVAVNRTTGVAGTPVAVGTAFDAANPVNWIYRVSDTSFVVNVKTAAAVQTITAGSISGTTITLGTGVNTTDNYSDCIQLSATSLLGQREDGSVEAINISGTTVTIGTAVSVGAVSTTATSIRINRVTDTTALIAFILTGGGTTATREVAARVASVSVTTVTLGTTTESNSNTSSATLIIFQPFADGGPFLLGNQLGGTSTTGEYRAISVSGTTATIGAITNRALDIPTNIIGYARTTFITETDKEILTAPTGQIVLAHKSGAIYAVTCAGTTLTFGADFTVTTNNSLFKNFVQDTIYSFDQAYVVRKLSFSGATISAALTIQTNSGLTYIESDTLSNEYAAYSGTYYTWNLPTSMISAVAVGYWIRQVGTTFTIVGQMT